MNVIIIQKKGSKKTKIKKTERSAFFGESFIQVDAF